MSADTVLPAQAVDTGVARPTGRRQLGGLRERVPAALRRAGPALLLYLAVRAVGLAVLGLCTWGAGEGLWTALCSWDGAWYRHIADSGYGFVRASKSGLVYSDLAFFPLFPGLIRAVWTVLPVSTEVAALLVAWLSSVLAAWGLYAVGERLHGRRAGTMLVLLWALLPHAVVQVMAYTEPLMTALAAWSLYAVLTRRWLYAATLAALAGVCRPNGVAMAAAVGCCALAELWRRRAEGGGRRWRLWLAVALAPLGWLGYVLWVGQRRGSLLGYFDVQRDWGSRFDFGADAYGIARDLVTGRGYLSYYMAMVLVAVAAVGLVLLLLDRPPLVIVVYTVVLVAIALGGTHFFASKPRFLLPAFPLLLPAAVALTAARPRTVAVTLGALTVLSSSYGGYLLTLAHSPL